MRKIIKQVLKEELEKNLILKGRIVFNPSNVTRKHDKQKDWKRIAMVKFDGEMTEYYSWFIERKYGITLNRPLRGAHITFINDAIRDIKGGDKAWEEVKSRWDGKEIDVIIDTDARTNSEYWWLMADSGYFKVIRSELGLGDPYFNYHMTIGYPNERNIEQSNYIHNLIKKGLTY